VAPITLSLRVRPRMKSGNQTVIRNAESEADTMPFKSKAQRRKFAQLLVEGKIKPETFEEWNRETGGEALPERVKSKKTKAAAKSKRRPASGRVRQK
jgi:hypothetical protein